MVQRLWVGRFILNMLYSRGRRYHIHSSFTHIYLQDQHDVKNVKNYWEVSDNKVFNVVTVNTMHVRAVSMQMKLAMIALEIFLMMIVSLKYITRRRKLTKIWAWGYSVGMWVRVFSKVLLIFLSFACPTTVESFVWWVRWNFITIL